MERQEKVVWRWIFCERLSRGKRVPSGDPRGAGRSGAPAVLRRPERYAPGAMAPAGWEIVHVLHLDSGTKSGARKGKRSPSRDRFLWEIL